MLLKLNINIFYAYILGELLELNLEFKLVKIK